MTQQGNAGTRRYFETYVAGLINNAGEALKYKKKGWWVEETGGMIAVLADSEMLTESNAPIYMGWKQRTM